MYHYVYQVDNLVNGKIYVGCHSTANLDDGYLGSGKNLQRAYKRHGVENFSKKILSMHSSAEEMFAEEARIVTDEFVKRSDTYNLKTGGFGGFDHIWKDALQRAKLLRSTPARVASSKRTIHIAREKMLENRRSGNISPELRAKLSVGGKKGGKIAGGSNALQEEEIRRRKELIKDIDLSKRGHVTEVAKRLECSHTHARRFINNHLSVA